MPKIGVNLRGKRRGQIELFSVSYLHKSVKIFELEIFSSDVFVKVSVTLYNYWFELYVTNIQIRFSCFEDVLN